MSSDLQWLLIRKWNSFQVKGAHGQMLSKEKGNLKNLNSQKYSGLANSRVLNIHPSSSGAISITKVKADAKPNQVAGARSHTTLRPNTSARRANRIAAAETAGKDYRPDLRKAAVARASALSRAHRRATYPRKERAPRGKKGAAAKESKDEEDDVVELD